MNDDLTVEHLALPEVAVCEDVKDVSGATYLLVRIIQILVGGLCTPVLGLQQEDAMGTDDHMVDLCAPHSNARPSPPPNAPAKVNSYVADDGEIIRERAQRVEDPLLASRPEEPALVGFEVALRAEVGGHPRLHDSGHVALDLLRRNAKTLDLSEITSEGESRLAFEVVRQLAKPMAQPQPAGDAEEPPKAVARDLGREALDLRLEAIAFLRELDLPFVNARGDELLHHRRSIACGAGHGALELLFLSASLSENVVDAAEQALDPGERVDVRHIEGLQVMNELRSASRRSEELGHVEGGRAAQYHRRPLIGEASRGSLGRLAEGAQGPGLAPAT